jgi:hypothetical protein
VTGDRFWHIVGPLLVGIAGFILAMSTMNTAVRYLSLYEPFFPRSVIPQAYVFRTDFLWLRAQSLMLSL